MPQRARIVPTGPESFAAEMIAVDTDFFGGCCEDCGADSDHGSEEESDEDMRPVLVVSR